MSTHLLSREGVDDVLASPALQRAAPDAFPIATTAALLNLLADFSSKTTTVFRGLIDSSHSAQQRLSSLSWRVAAANDSVAALERSRSHGGGQSRSVRAGVSTDGRLEEHFKAVMEVPSGPWRWDEHERSARGVPPWARALQARLDRCPPFPNFAGVCDYRLFSNPDREARILPPLLHPSTAPPRGAPPAPLQRRTGAHGAAPDGFRRRCIC